MLKCLKNSVTETASLGDGQRKATGWYWNGNTIDMVTG